MGTSLEETTTDKLGRRSGPRRKYTVAEKRQMVEDTLVVGASVPVVAQRHGVNANLLSVWRRLYKRGLLREGGVLSAALLPVKVSTPTLLPTQRAGPAKIPKPGPPMIEIEFPNGACLRVRHITQPLLRELVALLSAR
jgi:transposase